MDDVARPMGLIRRKAVYYYQRRVPKHLKSVYGGRSVIKKSLGTKDYGEAVELAQIEAVRLSAEFDAHRRRIATYHPGTSIPDARHQSFPDGPLARPSTRAEIERAVWVWFRDQREREIDRDITSSVPDLEDAEVALDEEETFFLAQDEPGTLASVQHVALELARERNLGVARGSKEFWLLYDRVRGGLIELVRQRRDRLFGDNAGRVHDQWFAQHHAPPTDALTVNELIKEFQNDPSRPETSAKKALDYGLAFRALREVVGTDTPVSEISREHCRSIRQLLVRLPTNASKKFPNASLEEAAKKAEQNGLQTLSATTINSYLQKLSTLFRWAVHETHMAGNPAERLSIVDKGIADRDRRLPFSDDQLKLIFGGLVIGGPKAQSKSGASVMVLTRSQTRYWVPRLAIYTGMRLNEICQLHVSDVSEQGGVWCIRVTDEGSTADNPKEMKTPAARRTIPIHRELINLGFLDFVVSKKRSGEVRLFSDLKRDRRGYYSDAFQKWFSRHLSNVGAKQPRTAFHSFRHNFRDAMREAALSEQVARALGGWSSQNTSEIYGKGMSIKMLNEALQKISYPVLDELIPNSIS